MTYYVGQRARLTTEVRDVTGALTNTTLVLTLTRPDGTTSTPGVTNSSTGVYYADVLFTQAGDWLRVWTGTGAVEVADTDQIHVVANSLRIVGLDEVKKHGNITGTASDNELLDFIGAAQRMIEAEIGPVVPKTYAKQFPTSGWPTIYLDEPPIVSVTSVQEIISGVTGTALASTAYDLDGDSGALTRLSGGVPASWGGREALITYQAGRNPIPENVRMAAKELVIHLWRSTQNMRGGRGRGAGESEVPSGPAGFAMPNRVRELLAGEGVSMIGVA